MNAGLPTTIIGLGATVTNLRQSPGTIVDGFCYNTTSTDGYIVLFDKLASQVTLGTTAPDYFIPVFALSTADLCKAGGGIIFRNAISVAVVDTVLGSTARTSNLAAVVQ